MFSYFSFFVPDPTHVTHQDIDDVRRLIEMLRKKQSLLSDITLPSEDSLCPICCAKPIAVMFMPCKHQSCRYLIYRKFVFIAYYFISINLFFFFSNCILQHLMNSKVCFYCKTMIKSIESPDGTVIYQNNEYIQTPTIFENI